MDLIKQLELTSVHLLANVCLSLLWRLWELLFYTVNKFLLRHIKYIWFIKIINNLKSLIFGVFSSSD